MDKRRYLTTLPITLLLLCLASWLGGIPAQAVEVEQTEEWKSYSNIRYGFELKYPKRLTLLLNSFDLPTSETSSVASWVTLTDNQIVEDPTTHKVCRRSLDIVYQNDLDSATALRTYVEQEYQKNKMVGYTSDQMTTQTLGSLTGYAYVVNHGYTGRHNYQDVCQENLVWYVANNDKVFRLIFPKDDEEFRTVLSTFHFSE